MKVLVIDDNVSFLTAVACMLRQWGAQVDTVVSATAGCESVASENYDFILLDLHMPERDGIWFMRQVHLPSTTRVILMSGFIPAQVSRGLAAMGFCDALHKPFDSEKLLEIFRQHVSPAAAA